MSSTPGSSQGSVLALLRASLPSLTASGQRIGELILAAPQDVVHLTVSDVAERTGASVGSVVRFCKDIGLRGFADLKLRLAAETNTAPRTVQGEVTDTDDPGTILDKVLADAQEAISSVRQTVTPSAFATAVTMLASASKVLCVAIGTSAPLAQDIAYRLRTTGVEAEHQGDPHIQHVTARLLSPAAVCLAISHTGQTSETLQATQAARAAGAGIIAVTSFYRSPLTELADVALVAASRETNFAIEAVASRIAHLAVLDALNVAVTVATLDKAREAQRRTADVLAEHRL